MLEVSLGLVLIRLPPVSFRLLFMSMGLSTTAAYLDQTVDVSSGSAGREDGSELFTPKREAAKNIQ